jgi:predicted transcriptional regulator
MAKREEIKQVNFRSVVRQDADRKHVRVIGDIKLFELMAASPRLRA